MRQPLNRRKRWQRCSTSPSRFQQQRHSMHSQRTSWNEHANLLKQKNAGYSFTIEFITCAGQSPARVRIRLNSVSSKAPLDTSPWLEQNWMLKILSMIVVMGCMIQNFRTTKSETCLLFQWSMRQAKLSELLKRWTRKACRNSQKKINRFFVRLHHLQVSLSNNGFQSVLASLVKLQTSNLLSSFRHQNWRPLSLAIEWRSSIRLLGLLRRTTSMFLNISEMTNSVSWFISLKNLIFFQHSRSQLEPFFDSSVLFTTSIFMFLSTTSTLLSTRHSLFSMK